MQKAIPLPASNNQAEENTANPPPPAGEAQVLEPRKPCCGGCEKNAGAARSGCTGKG